MDPLRLIARMSQLARRPPSRRAVMIGLVAIAAALALWAIETAGWWPDWATVERTPRPVVLPAPAAP